MRRTDGLIRLGIVLAGLAVICCSGGKEGDSESGEWISLFNGRDLAGWEVKFAGHEQGVNLKDTFRVEDGVLKVSYDGYERFEGEFGHLFTENSYSDYIIRLEYRFLGDQTPGGPSWGFRNSGVMVHSQPPESMSLGQNFPVSVEVQLLGGDGANERPTANVCTPGTNIVLGGELVTRHCTNSTSRTYHGDQWVNIEIVVRGNSLIRHILDGQVVLEYERPQLDPEDEDARKIIEGGNLMLREGRIALQAESHPVEFRKIEILIL